MSLLALFLPLVLLGALLGLERVESWTTTPTTPRRPEPAREPQHRAGVEPDAQVEPSAEVAAQVA